MKDEAPPSPARLIIADDHVLIREGTRAMLAKEPDIEVVGEAENGRQALELCRSLSPDLVLMDIRMPEMDGLAATRAIQVECPTTSVLIVTSYENLDHLLEAIRAGAAGYVLKEATKQQLLSAIRRALGGGLLETIEFADDSVDFIQARNLASGVVCQGSVGTAEASQEARVSGQKSPKEVESSFGEDLAERIKRVD